VLLTHLTEQLDSLAGAAETVAEAITSEHAMQTPAAGQARFMPAAAAGGSVGSSSSGTGSRKQRAEARQRAFAAAALSRCTARLTGKRASAAAAGGGETAPGPTTTRNVADEVAALVGAATSVDKLSRMYEGWAAWL
jgi:PI-3-kinase-related kinase SMG-1